MAAPTSTARALLALFLGLHLAAPGAVAEAQDDGGELAEGVYARVIVERTELRSGPGGSFQRVRVAERGDVFRVVERAPRGYWFRVELPDGLLAWIHGDTVYNHRVSREEATGGRVLPNLFAPPPLPSATGELAVQFGILGLENPGGFMAIRPALFVAPELSFELNLAGSVSDTGRFLLAGGGAIVNLFPRSPVVPFVTVGGGFSITDRNADAFLVESGTTGLLYGGGGLRLAFRYRITLRIEMRGYAFFDENRIVGLEEVTGGLTVFF
jgi:uncharacterized protein YgiM (DUF1202 family)